MAAVDLSQFRDAPAGPREKEAMLRELEILAATRELALRAQVELEQRSEGYSRALSTLVDLYGEDDGQGKKFLVVDASAFERTKEHVAAFSMDAAGRQLHLVNTYAHAGSWTVTNRKPSEEEKKTLPWFDELPEKLSRPGPMTAITGTKKGLRVAEWTPA